MILIDFECLQEMVNSLAYLSLLPQDYAGIVMDICVILVNLQCFVKMGQCLIKPSLAGKETPEIMMGNCIFRLDL